MAEDMQQIAHAETRPLPTPNGFSQPFWDAAHQHSLRLQRCDVCNTVRFYPRPRCPTCLSDAATWTEMSGRGSVYSFTVVHRPLARWFADRMPLVVAVVELDENVRMMTNIAGCEPDDVVVGMRVQVTWHDADDEITLPWFEPESE